MSKKRIECKISLVVKKAFCFKTTRIKKKKITVNTDGLALFPFLIVYKLTLNDINSTLYSNLKRNRQNKLDYK